MPSRFGHQFRVQSCLFRDPSPLRALDISCAFEEKAISGWQTLSGTLDDVSNTNSLAVPQIRFTSLAVAFITGVGEMRHGVFCEQGVCKMVGHVNDRVTSRIV